MDEVTDNLYFAMGQIDQGCYLILITPSEFWPDGQGSIEKRYVASAKRNGAKSVILNDLETANLYICDIDTALRGGNEEQAVFLRHNMRRMEESDIDKQE